MGDVASTLLPVPVLLITDSTPDVACTEPVELPKVMPPVNVCNPVHVGTIACDRAGAPSERKKVVAEPGTAVSPTEAVGLAPAAPLATAAHVGLEPEPLVCRT